MSLIAEFVNQRVWAVVGASSNPRKYGNIIFHDLRDAGYEIYGVNPNESSVDGIPVYPTLASLPVKPEVVDIVVPPHVTESIVRDCYELGIERVWMQPGAESAEAVAFCEDKGIKVIYGGPCAMVSKRYWT